ncbi:MAG: 5'/3'-nucleotidase SurE [Acidimicrobiales bacterium]
MSNHQILVTNDDGIDSVGLHVLARAMRPFGEVTIVAPDSEYSGAGASIGPLHLLDTVIREESVDGVDGAWTVNGPPALCVFYARMGAFGFEPDLIVSGINPGANLGRAVYHSGTIGAVLTGRSGTIPGIAVSQSFADPRDDSEEARLDYDERVGRQLWDSAAEVAVEVVAGILGEEFEDVAVINLNVPNRPVSEMEGWRWTEVGLRPPWAMTEAKLVPRDNEPAGNFRVETSWGEQAEQPPDTDAAAVLAGYASLSMLSRITALPVDSPKIDARLDGLLG